jgi:hypothetical protein
VAVDRALHHDHLPLRTDLRRKGVEHRRQRRRCLGTRSLSAGSIVVQNSTTASAFGA